MLNQMRIVNFMALTFFHKAGDSFVSKFLAFSALLMLLSACGVGNTDQASVGGIVVDSPVAFIKRPLLFEDDDADQIVNDDPREPQAFRPGAVLFVKDRASPSAEARDITSSVFSDPGFLNDEGQLLYDVRDLSVSHDGSRLVFAMRAPEIEDADEEDQPRWNIWTYDFDSNELNRVISSDITAEEGHDIAPAFLPDDRIVFSSTRQRTTKAILLDEGKGQFSGLEEGRDVEAFVLHVMNPDGTDIQQITFNQSHDLNPVVRPNGKIVFSRWDQAGQTQANGMNLYQVNPDGTELSYLYGRHSHDSGDAGSTVQFTKPIESEDGNIIVQLREFQPQVPSMQPTEIYIDSHIESDLQIDGLGSAGQAALINGLNTSGAPSLNGSYGAAFPLYDGTGRLLTSWSICRVVRSLSPEDQADPNIINTNPIEICTAEKLASGTYESAPPLYGLWVVDGGTQLPIELPQEGWQFEEAVVATERSRPDFIPDAVLDPDEQSLATDGFGSIHIRSVYDFDGVDTTPAGIPAMADPLQTAADARPARFVRIEKAVSLPSDEVYDFVGTAFGRSAAQSMREILGYTPVEPDGSVKVAVPANVAFAISILDENGRRTSQRHQNWLTVRPGESITCIGCHTGNSEVPHGRYDAQPDAANTGAPTTGQPFPNTEPALFTDMGETMAETYSRINGIRTLSADIEYMDDWTDELITPKAAAFSYAYADLESMPPVNSAEACGMVWSKECRITLNYPVHIHPLWSLNREVRDINDVVVADHTCTSCHNDEDAMAAVQIPEAHLDLSDGPSTDEPNHFKSYRELLFNDNEQEIVGGILMDRLEDSGELLVDEDGEPILDIDGNEQNRFDPVIVTPALRTAGALASTNRFFSLFEGGSHDAYLSPAELKLLSEWLDIGAQYYNNPFLAPEN